MFAMQQQLREETYRWLPYHRMKVFDPKERDILVAPFRDRILHQAICQVIGPFIDKKIPKNSYACRKNMGNSQGVLTLAKNLTLLGPNRYSIKLDIRKYFESISHEGLTSMLSEIFSDQKLLRLLESLIASHPPFAQRGKGIPIGNVSSQHFASLYLSPIDRLAETQKDLFYIRYMDDMVLSGQDPHRVMEFSHQIMDKARELKLEIPQEKTVFLGKDPIPFLGFVVDEKSIRPLSRNLKRHQKHVKRLQKKGARLSKIAEIETSFSAWAKLGSPRP